MAKHHDYLCHMVKKSAGEDKEKYIKRICQDVGTAKVQNNTRAVYESIRNDYREACKSSLLKTNKAKY